MPFFLVETETVSTTTRRVEADDERQARALFPEGQIIHSESTMETPTSVSLED